MKAFTITELELSGLSKWGFAEKTATATGFSLFAFALGLAGQLLFCKPIPELALSVCAILIPAAILLGLLCLFVGRKCAREVSIIESTIRTETTHKG